MYIIIFNQKVVYYIKNTFFQPGVFLTQFKMFNKTFEFVFLFDYYLLLG